MIIENNEEIKSEEVTEAQAPTINPEAINPEQELSSFSFNTPPQKADFSFVRTPIQKPVPQKTDSAVREQAVITSHQMGVPWRDVEESLKNGEYSTIAQGEAANWERKYKESLEEGNTLIQEAPDVKSVSDILTALETNLGRPPSFAEQRAEYAKYLSGFSAKSQESQKEVDLGITSEIIKNNALAAEAGKRLEEYSNSISYLKMGLDFFEFLSPTATVSEEMFKNSVESLYEKLDGLEGLPADKQKQLVDSMIDAAIKQETILFNNNNSLMTLGQIDTFYRAVGQGAAMKAEGYTEAEISSMLETAFNGTLFVGEISSIVKSVGAMGKFLMRRIHSAKTLKEVFSEQERLANQLISEEAARRFSPENAQYVYLDESTAPSLQRTVGDKRKRLEKTAKQKGTTKERKALEQEKKDLGARTYELKNKNVNQEARQITKEEKIKFKEAKKRVEEQRDRELEIIEKRQKTNQELINEFDTRAKAESELSRIDTFLKDGRLKETDLLEETDEIFLAGGAKGSFKHTPQRENYSVFDTVAKFAPLQLIKMAEEGDSIITSLAKATAQTTEEMGEKSVPIPSEKSKVGMPETQGARVLNDMYLLDEDVENVIGLALGRELDKANGTSLKRVNSSGAFKANTDPSVESLGTYTFKLQDGSRGAYKTKEAAEQARDRSGLGYPSRIVKEPEGYYVEMDVDHYLNTTTDVMGLKLTGSTPSAIASAALPHSKLVEEELLRGIYSLINVNRSTVQELEQKIIDSVKRLEVKERQQLMEILARGDADEAEWTNIEVYKNDTKNDITENAFLSYREMREVYDIIFNIREKNYYNSLRKQGIKYIEFGDERGLGKAIQKSEIEAKVVYDSRLGRFIPKEQLGENDLIVKLHAPKEVKDKKFITYARVLPEDIKPLQRGATLNKRKGHIDRMYRDAGWIVRSPVVRNINNEEVLDSRVTHIVKTEADAKKISEEIKGSTFEASRENKDETFSDSQNIQFGYGASHLKSRGEIVKGSDGLADVHDSLESIFYSVAGIERALNYNAYAAAKTKFLKGFAEYLENGAATPLALDVNAMRNNKRIPKDVLRELENHHGFLVSLMTHNLTGTSKKIDAIVSALIPRQGKEGGLARVQGNLSKVTTEIYIVWNGLYQAVANSQGVLYNLASAEGAGTQALVQLAGLVKASRGDISWLAKSLGDEKLAKELLEELQSNGLLDAVARMDDFLDMARTKKAGFATKLSSKPAEYAKDVFKGVRGTTLGIQEKAIVLNNAVSYLIEFNALRKAKGKNFKFDASDRAEASTQAQKRTQTQNRLDTFFYQRPDNAAALVGQFFQAVYKGFLDWVVEPQWEVIRGVSNAAAKNILRTDKRLGSLGKNVSRNADTLGKAFMATLLTYSVYGIEGGVGRDLGRLIEDNIRDNYEKPEDVPFLVDLFLDGGANVAINSSLPEGSKVDINATLSPAGFIDMLFDVFSDPTKMNLIGASLHSTAGILESIYSSARVIYEGAQSEDISTEDIISSVMREGFENLKLLDSSTKAYMAWWSGRNASSRTGTSELPIEKAEAILKIFGIKPEMETDFYDRMDFVSGSSEMGYLAQKSLDFSVKQYQAQIASSRMIKETFESDPEAALEEYRRLKQKWINFAKQTTDSKWHSKVEETFHKLTFTEDKANPDIYLKPYIKRAYQGRINEYLRIIEQKAPEGSDLRKEAAAAKKLYEIQERQE